MISQNLGLPYLIPLAIDRLRENILAEGDLYPGDLLVTVTSVQRQFWIEHPDYQKQLREMIADNPLLIVNDKLKVGEGFLES